MGFLTGGPFYDMIGRTGNNVGRRVKGKNVFSMRPHPSSKPPTPPQINQRAKFGLMAGWLSWITPLINIGFKNYEQNGSAMNAALSYNLQHAITGIAPNYLIDYAEILYSRGKLSPAFMAEVTAAAAAVEFDWLDDFQPGYGELTDRVTVFVYNPAKDQYVTLPGAAARSALTFNLPLPADFSGDSVHCYISMVALQGGVVSDSAYLGTVTIL